MASSAPHQWPSAKRREGPGKTAARIGGGKEGAIRREAYDEVTGDTMAAERNPRRVRPLGTIQHLRENGDERDKYPSGRGWKGGGRDERHSEYDDT